MAPFLFPDDVTRNWSTARRVGVMTMAELIIACAIVGLALRFDWWFFAVLLAWPPGVLLSVVWRNRPRQRR